MGIGLAIGIGLAVIVLLIIVVVFIYLYNSDSASASTPATTDSGSSTAVAASTTPDTSATPSTTGSTASTPAPSTTVSTPTASTTIPAAPTPTTYVLPSLAPIPIAATRTLTNTMDPSGAAGLPDIQQDERLYSNNKQYYITMQGDGNLVGYNVNGNKSFWASKSNAKGGPFTAAIQSDGQLVVKNGAGAVVWINKKSGGPNPIITLQDDRNIVGYVGASPASRTSVYWTTKTNA